jgi:hypothetical protein
LKERKTERKKKRKKEREKERKQERKKTRKKENKKERKKKERKKERIKEREKERKIIFLLHTINFCMKIITAYAVIARYRLIHIQKSRFRDFPEKSIRVVTSAKKESKLLLGKT